MALCGYSFPLSGWLVPFPSPDALQTPRVLPIDWLFVHLNAPFVWRIMIDGLLGGGVFPISCSVAPVWGIWLGQRSEWDQGYFWGLFWSRCPPRLRVGPGCQSYMRVRASELQPWNLILAGDCTVWLRRKSTTRGSNPVRAALQNQNGFLSSALFSWLFLFFISLPEQLEKTVLVFVLMSLCTLE